jgi:DNA polymerase-3 subunit chi
MTAVAFHTGIADKLGYACRLLRKAYRQGARVVVNGSAADLLQLDVQLWIFDTDEFVPHQRLGAQAVPLARHSRTPIWLVEAGAQSPAADVLVNLGPAVATSKMPYPRVIELVSTDPGDKVAGRRRWQTYRASGIEPALHSQESPV